MRTVNKLMIMICVMNGGKPKLPDKISWYSAKFMNATVLAFTVITVAIYDIPKRTRGASGLRQDL